MNASLVPLLMKFADAVNRQLPDPETRTMPGKVATPATGVTIGAVMMQEPVTPKVTGFVKTELLAVTMTVKLAPEVTVEGGLVLKVKEPPETVKELVLTVPTSAEVAVR